MTQYKIQQIEEQLRNLRRYSPGVVGSLIFSFEGLPIAADLSPDVADELRAAAKSAAMVALGERIALELGRGRIDQIFIGGADAGHVIVAIINKESALTVLCGEETRLAMLLLDIEHSIEDLRTLI